MVFSLPDGVVDELLSPLITLPEHLANVEWFTTPGAPDPNHLLYKIKHSMKDGARKASVIPVTNIC